MKLRSILYYLFIIGGGLALGYWIILSGGNIESNTTLKQVASEGSAWQHFVEGIQTNLAVSTYILFMTAVVTFFLSSIIFTPTKLTGLILIIIATAWGGFSSLKLWRKRITGIQAVLRGYEEEFHT